MTASELKARHEQANPDSLFFSRNNMKFAGDTMANFGVRKYVTAQRTVTDTYELYRKKPVKLGMKDSFYFDKNFNRVFSNKIKSL